MSYWDKERLDFSKKYEVVYHIPGVRFTQNGKSYDIWGIIVDTPQTQIKGATE